MIDETITHTDTVSPNSSGDIISCEKSDINLLKNGGVFQPCEFSVEVPNEFFDTTNIWIPIRFETEIHKITFSVETQRCHFKDICSFGPADTFIDEGPYGNQ